MANTFDVKVVSDKRAQFEQGVTSRELGKTNSQAARNFLRDIKALTASANAFADVLPEGSFEVPVVLDDEAVTFVQGIADSWQSKPSEELTKLKGELASFLTVADSLGIPQDERERVEAALKRYNAASAVLEAPKSTNGGKGKTERTRNLSRVPVIAHTRADGTVAKPIQAGASKGVGDWVSARYEMKKRVDTASEEAGDDAASVWAQVAGQLIGWTDELLAVEDGKQESAHRTVTTTHGDVFDISYS